MAMTRYPLEIEILTRKSKMENNYNINVFVNCPFDEDYISLLRPLLFTIVYLGFKPRIALEEFNSGRTRFDKLCKLIAESKYGIHDLSRIQATEKGEHFRLNMAFELGLDIGCRVFESDMHADKRHLILEEKRYRYQAAISDLSNSDIKIHKNDPTKIVRQIRHWFVENGLTPAPSATAVWYKFNEFMLDFHESRKADGFENEDIYEMPVPEYLHFVEEWCNQSSHLPNPNL